jgi:hypothetical protein
MASVTSIAQAADNNMGPSYLHQIKVAWPCRYLSTNTLIYRLSASSVWPRQVLASLGDICGLGRTLLDI